MSFVSDLVFRVRIEGDDEVVRRLERTRSAAASSSLPSGRAPSGHAERQARISTLAAGTPILPSMLPPGYDYHGSVNRVRGPATHVPGVGMVRPLMGPGDVPYFGPSFGPQPTPVTASLEEQIQRDHYRLRQQEAARRFRERPDELSFLEASVARWESAEFERNQRRLTNAQRGAASEGEREQRVMRAEEAFRGVGDDLHPLARARRMAQGADVLQMRGGAANENQAAQLRSAEAQLRNQFRDEQRLQNMDPVDRANLASWRWGLTALTLMFGGMPVVQAYQGVRQQGAGLVPPTDERLATDIDRRRAMRSLYQQTEPGQQWLDQLGTRAIDFASQTGIGAALPVASAALSGGAAAANIASVVTMFGALVPAISANTAAIQANTMSRAGVVPGAVASATGGVMPIGPGRHPLAGTPVGGLPPLSGPSSAISGSATTLGLGTGAIASAGWLPGLGMALGVGAMVNDLFSGTDTFGYRRVNAERARLIEEGLPRSRADTLARSTYSEGAPGESEYVDAAGLIAARRVQSDPRYAPYRRRIQIDEAQRAADPGGFQAQQDYLGDQQAELGFERQRRQVAYGRIDDQRQYTRLVSNQQFERERLDTQYGRQIADIGLQFRRQETAILTSRARQGREIGIQYDNQIQDIGIGYQDTITDIDRGFGRTVRDIGISTEQGREDIQRGYRRGVRNMIYGQIGGLAGSLLQLRASRRDALEDLQIREQRALERAGVSRGDSEEDAGIQQGRAVAGAGRARDRATASANRTTGDALEDARTSLANAYEDAGRKYVEAIDDLAKAQQRERDQYLEDARVREQRRQEEERELARERELRKARQRGIQDEIEETGKFVQHMKEINRFLERQIGDQQGRPAQPAPSTTHTGRAMPLS